MMRSFDPAAARAGREKGFREDSENSRRVAFVVKRPVRERAAALGRIAAVFAPVARLTSHGASGSLVLHSAPPCRSTSPLDVTGDVRLNADDRIVLS
jgi:hypothetical protein